MEYKDFISILASFGYLYTKHNSISHEHYQWRYLDTKNDIVVSYIIDENGIIRQQFSEVHDLVELHIFERGTSGRWSKYSFDECIRFICENKFCDINSMRNYKLKSIFNVRT